MRRRKFISAGLRAGFGLAAISVAGCASAGNSKKDQNASKRRENAQDSNLKGGASNRFKMKFAPRQWLFRNVAGKDEAGRMRWLKEQGFYALEGAFFIQPMKKYSSEEIDRQLKIGECAAEFGFEMGGCSAMNEKDSPIMSGEKFKMPDGKVVLGRSAIRDLLVEQMEATFAVLRRLRSCAFIIGAGSKDPSLPDEKQFENVVENLKFCARHCERNGFTMLIEPLNTSSHPNIYFDNATLGAKASALVGSKNCRILFDIFHEHMQTGSLKSLENPDVWSQIGAFHFSDSPTRQEPFTGKIDYRRLMGLLKRNNWSGIIGLEHGQSLKGAKGDLKVLEAYRKLDAMI
ncbi:MAG: hypothetical protein DBX55_01575 [Verrucomicrobia bacterium]|nr:MAG: hypothetical protein DBX55_01575 [Verrucomicrobiota bacterium]